MKQTDVLHGKLSLTTSTEICETAKFFDSKIEVSPEVISQEISGETVILDLKSESYFGLDQTGTRIWELLQEKKVPAEILQVMESEYEVDPETLKIDLLEHLQLLEKAGLINFVESS